jgi:osmotically-inducible protein OsmY
VSQAGDPNPAQNTSNRSNQADRTDRSDPSYQGQGGGGDQRQMQGNQGNQGNPQQSQQGTQPDNTGRNKADQPTAEDQGGSPQDREMTRKIRRELVQSNNLSSTAKNVKIITENGKVTIRGPVDSEQEKEAIKAIAEKAAGQGNVTDQLEPKNR